MSASPSLPSPDFLAGAFFRIWADYWLERDGHIPPIHYYDQTRRGGALIVAPVAPDLAAEFAHSLSSQSPITILVSGDWSDPAWLGTWSVLSVIHQTPTDTPWA